MLNFLVVVPTKNSEQFVHETLNSVARQEFGVNRVHLHIQDSISVDATLDIVRDFASQVDCGLGNKKLSISYASAPDRGMYDAINIGMEMTGVENFSPDVFFWLNSDDILLPGAITNLAKTFSDPAIEWAIGMALDIDENGGQIYSEQHARIPISKLRSGDFNYAGSQWIRAESTAFRYTTYLQSGGFDGQFRLAGDYQVFLKLSLITEPAYVDYGVKAFRKHAGQLSRNLIAYEHERSRIKYFSAKSHDVESASEPEKALAKNLPLFFYPDYTGGNSYQNLLYDGINATGVKDLASLEVIGLKERRGILHIHWLNQIIGDSRDKALENCERFKAAISLAKKNGLKIVFTVHNISSHEGMNSDLETDILNYLFDVSAVVHVHHAIVSYQILNRYGKLPWGKLIIGEHGPYPEPAEKVTAGDLEKFDIVDSNLPYIAIPGQIRPYKNLGLLIDLIDELDKSNEMPNEMLFLFVGSFHPTTSESDRHRLLKNKRVRIAKNWLTEDEFSRILMNARFTLLSYSDVSTSGALFHSLSMGVPVIAPDLGTIPSYVFDDYNGYVYKNHSTESARKAVLTMLRKMHCDHNSFHDMRLAAKTSAQRLSWEKTLRLILSKISN
ncbi:glycosyltransferase [Janthinobacterium sp. 17J80-10]|uniref:glycosyltransferase n=1 Tax=Janthinobacterium sp. 17J80-10 TaxID=2497863 RepID=UPI0010057671|nr:glycosyltransferase [Janthinobacterium sp. 17J80-10]QAU35537.1 glycosyltransferase [Janthinobacterium sp. 17J80-10]